MEYHTRPCYWSPRSKPQPRKAVVSIPVLDGNDRPPAGVPARPADSAALRIQRTFRGFLARKSVRAVRELEQQVGEMERRIGATRELLARDQRERLKAGEALMAILLSLDSVRGARNYRRKVVRRAVALQDSLEAEAEVEAEAEEESAVEEERGDGDREGAEDAVGRVMEVMEALARRVEELERRVSMWERGRRKRRSATAASRRRSLP